jgi:hypothetical protein|tara:strand:+ start:414 stop:620 length:207 start_codon:yes stop_codon:yes gene_type:complete
MGFGQKIKKGLKLGAKIGLGVGAVGLGIMGMKGASSPKQIDTRQAERKRKMDEIDELYANYNAQFRSG